MSDETIDPAPQTYRDVLAYMIERELDAGETVDEESFARLRDAAMEEKNPDVAAAYLSVTYEQALDRVIERKLWAHERSETWRRHHLGLDRDPEDRLPDVVDDAGD